MAEDICFIPLHVFPALNHLRKEKAVVFIEYFCGVVAVLANTVGMIHILIHTSVSTHRATT